MKLLWWTSILGLSLLLTGCNTADETTAVAAMASYTHDYIDEPTPIDEEVVSPEVPEAVEETGITGNLTHLTYGDVHVYLFGSMHVGSPDWFPLHPAVYRAMDVADVFAFEYDLSIDPVVIASMTVQHLLTSGQGSDLPPFVRYTQAMIEAFEAVGLSQQYSLDKYILAQAVANNAPVEGLIPLAQELALVMNQPIDVQDWLVSHFPDLDELVAEAYDTKYLYATQDFEGLTALMTASEDGYNLLEQWLREEVLAKRTDLFAAGIVQLVSEMTSGSLFVTVGIGHLLGEGSVAEMLVQQGFLPFAS